MKPAAPLVWRSWALLLVVGWLLAACTLIQPYREIFGSWRAEQLSIGGIGLSVSPSLQFEAGRAVIGGRPTKVESYSREGNRVTVQLEGALSLNFEMQGKDAMILEVPLVGKVRYTRVP